MSLTTSKKYQMMSGILLLLFVCIISESFKRTIFICNISNSQHFKITPNPHLKNAYHHYDMEKENVTLVWAKAKKNTYQTVGISYLWEGGSEEETALFTLIKLF